MDKPPTDADVTYALSKELTELVCHLDHSLDELAGAAKKVTGGLTSLADLAGRIRRNVDDPPAERHTLDIHGGGHGQEADFVPVSGPDTDTDPS